MSRLSFRLSSISLLAREQLEILAKIAAGLGTPVEVNYSGVAAEKVTLTLENGRRINIVAVGYVK